MTDRYSCQLSDMRKLIRTDVNFDLGEQFFSVGQKQAACWFVDALTKDDVLEWLMERLFSLPPAALIESSAEAFAKQYIPYNQVTAEPDAQAAAVAMLSGQTALLIEGLDAYLLIDLREYPSRSLEEPEEDRVLLGAHDGFGENIKTNLALIRRRIRSPQLRAVRMTVGSASHTDVAVCWLDGAADPANVQRLLDRLKAVKVKTLTMGHESLSEAILKPQWWNPFPSFRYTERPDRATAALAEGKLILLVDNSPIASLLPTALPDFVQDTNEYYFPPLTGTFLRWMRALIFLASLIGIPLWYLLIPYSSDDRWLALGQLLLAELILDGVKLASLHTPNSMSTLFGIVGALLLGEFAVQGELFSEQILLLMSFQAVATFIQPSFALGYTLKFYRLLFTLLSALLGWWGFSLGVIIMLATAATTRTLGEEGYLTPLIPFHPQQLWRLLWRRRIHEDNT